MYPTRYVMNAILERSFREARTDLTPMKAQKMLFFTHGWHLAITGQPAIDQPFKPWRFGPVAESVYHDLKNFGNKNISRYIRDWEQDFEEDGGNAYVIDKANDSFYEVLDITWEKYIGISATVLSTMTHERGTPWYRAKKEKLMEIPNSYIQEYFVGLASR